jgi:hypothetical protein
MEGLVVKTDEQLKDEALKEIKKNLNAESLKILAELSRYPGIDKVLKAKLPMIKLFI